MLSRRRLLKALAATGALTFSPLSRFLDSDAMAASNQDGELYGGFLLLSADAALPVTVKFPAEGMPVLCGLGGGSANAGSRHFDTHSDVSQAIRVPLYTLSYLPTGCAPAGADVIEYEWGSIFSISLDFRDPTSSIVTLYIQTTYPKPYPFRLEEGRAVQKVNHLPDTGLAVKNVLGYDYYWINNGFFYQLSLKAKPSADEAVKISSSLILSH